MANAYKLSVWPHRMKDKAFLITLLCWLYGQVCQGRIDCVCLCANSFLRTCQPFPFLLITAQRKIKGWPQKLQGQREKKGKGKNEEEDREKSAVLIILFIIHGGKKQRNKKKTQVHVYVGNANDRNSRGKRIKNCTQLTKKTLIRLIFDWHWEELTKYENYILFKKSHFFMAKNLTKSNIKRWVEFR